jgi:hypothetical protein
LIDFQDDDDEWDTDPDFEVRVVLVSLWGFFSSFAPSPHQQNKTTITTGTKDTTIVSAADAQRVKSLVHPGSVPLVCC